MVVVRYVSTFQPIRTAVGDLGYGNVMQGLEEDLVRWAIEAQDYIGRDKAKKMETKTLIVKDNKILYCADMSIIDCVSVGGILYDFKDKHNCYDHVTSSCSCACDSSQFVFTTDGCYIRFEPSLADGTEVVVKYLARPMDDNGYPMIADICVFAIQEYIKWKLCFRFGDNRTSACEGRWYALCRQARPLFNNITQRDIERIGYLYTTPTRRVSNYGLGYGTTRQ